MCPGDSDPWQRRAERPRELEPSPRGGSCQTEPTDGRSVNSGYQLSFQTRVTDLYFADRDKLWQCVLP